jgi:2-methylcitrate dehydratase PrpD
MPTRSPSRKIVRRAAAAPSHAKPAALSPMMKTLSAYMARAIDRPLPARVAEKTRHHIADSLAAIVSGSRLPPGERGIAWTATQGGVAQACVMGTDHVTSATLAAFANGMSAHADETDDSHQGGLFHPGCTIIPAAWAIAELERRSGAELLRAVALGYDIGARIAMALGGIRFLLSGHGSHAFGGLFGAAAAAGALHRFDAQRMRWLISYTAQQASGISCWIRDPDHIEKAFDFAGMPARNAVSAASMVAAGCTGGGACVRGRRNIRVAYDRHTDTSHVTRELGRTWEIMRSNIKNWSVGSPIQAALDSLLALIREHGITAPQVRRLHVQVQDTESEIVDNRDMPDICMQHLLAVMLLDGGLSFASSHDEARMHDPAVLALRQRIAFEGSAELSRAGGRQAIVAVELADGRRLRHHTEKVRGTWQNPMTREEVDAKCLPLMAPVLGTRRARALLDRVWSLDEVDDIRSLRRLLQPA